MDQLLQLAVSDAEQANREKRMMQQVPHILVGTPNRLLQCYEKGIYALQHTKTLVLDEADDLLQFSKRFADEKTRKKRERHPMPVEKFLDTVVQTPSDEKIRWIVAGATLKREKHEMWKRGWIRGEKAYIINEHQGWTVPHELVTLEGKTDLTDQIMAVAAQWKGENATVCIPNDASVADTALQLEALGVNASVLTYKMARGLDMTVDSVYVLGSPTQTELVHLAGRTGRLSAGGRRSGRLVQIVS